MTVKTDSFLVNRNDRYNLCSQTHKMKKIILSLLIVKEVTGKCVKYKAENPCKSKEKLLKDQKFWENVQLAEMCKNGRFIISTTLNKSFVYNGLFLLGLLAQLFYLYCDV